MEVLHSPTRSIALFAFGPLLGALWRHCGRKLVQSDFYDFPFYGGTCVHHRGWIVAGVFFRIVVSRLTSSRQLDFPSCVEFIVLDDS
jgi:hypothetical protein